MKNQGFSMGVVLIAVGVAMLGLSGGEAVCAPDENALYTNVYQVPRNFLSSGAGGAPVDPPAAGAEVFKPRPTAIEILNGAGITFGEGASAIYQPASSQLIVRNTLEQMELVEAYVESIINQVKMQVHVTTLFVETDEPILRAEQALNPDDTAKGTGSPTSRSLVVESSEDLAALLAEKDLVEAVKKHTVTNLKSAISGVFTDQQMAMVRGKLAKRESASVVEGGSATLRSGKGQVLLVAGDRAVGVKEVVIGLDGFTVDLSLYSQGPLIEGAARRNVNEFSLTIWDGQTVAVERALPDGRYQYDFITARLIDPAGLMARAGENVIDSAGAAANEEADAGAADPSTDEVRRVEQADQAALRGNQQVADEGSAAIEAKLKNIILPSVEFTDTPLRAALEFLAQKSAELDVDEPDPAKKGINFILQLGSGDAASAPALPAADPGAPVFAPALAGPAGGGFAGDVGDTLITLKLSNVPLVEAVRYTTALAQLKYKVEPHAVIVLPSYTPDADLYTNVYQVPPNFLSSVADLAPIDPFAPGADALTRRLTAIEILKRVGIVFPEGASAVYNPSTSQLIVRNTLGQMELVEAYIESLVNQVEMQVYVTTLFVETDGPLFPVQALIPDDTAKGTGLPTSRSLVVGSPEDLATLLAEKDLVEAVKKHTVTNLKSEIGGVYTDAQIKVLRGMLAKRESTSVVEGGNVMLRSGQGQVLLAAGERAVGVKEVVIGMDGFTVDLSLYSQAPSLDGAERRDVDEVSLTIWDGQTVAIERALPDGRYQYDFITARLIDPAGRMVHAGESVIDSAGAGADQEADVGAADLSIDELRRVEQADQAALRGNQQVADEDYAAAQASFLEALKLLPDIDLVEDREKAFLQQFLRAMREARKDGGE